MGEEKRREGTDEGRGKGYYEEREGEAPPGG